MDIYKTLFMYKFLFASDIHLKNYSKYNRYPGQRLESFLELARDIVKVGKAQGITILLLGGDLVDTPHLTPKEVHAYFEMMRILSEGFTTIYSIVGNHDMALKTDSFTDNDTVITLAEMFKNVHFLHREIITLNEPGLPRDFTIALENWVPKHKMDWYEGMVDMYMSHAAIDYLETGMYGIDTSVFDGKFRYGYFGDIHVHGSLGNITSIGNTKQESLSDRFEGGVLVVSVDPVTREQTQERVLLDPAGEKYLKLIKTENESLEGWEDPITPEKSPRDFSSMKYYVYRPQISKKDAKVYEAITTELVAERLLEVVTNEKLLDIHKEMASDINYEAIDFNFQFEYIDITNFRSIDKLRLTGSTSYIFKGLNGTGKSTVMTAFKEAWVGKNPKDHMRIGTTEVTIRSGLTYQGMLYEIKKSNLGPEFIIGGEVQKYGSVNELYKDVLEKLPFLRFPECFMFNSTDIRLLGNLRVDRRFELLSRYYKLDYLDGFNNKVVEVIKEEVTTNKENLKLYEELTTRNEVARERFEVLESRINNHYSSLPETEVVPMNGEQVGEYFTLLEDFESYTRMLNIKQSELKQTSILESYLKEKVDTISKELSDNESKKPTLSREEALGVVEDLSDLVRDLLTVPISLTEIEDLKEKVCGRKEELVILKEESSLTEMTIKGLKEVSFMDKLGSYQSELTRIEVEKERKTSELMKEVGELKNAITSKELLIASKERELESTKEATKCKTCFQPVDKSLQLKILTNDIKSLSEELAELMIKKGEMNVKIEQFNTVYLLEVSAELEATQVKISELKEHQERLETLEKDFLNTSIGIRELESKITYYEESIKEKLSKVEKLQEREVNYLTRYSTDNLKLVLDNHQEIIYSWRSYQSELDRLESSLKETQESLDKNISDAKSISEEISRVEEHLKEDRFVGLNTSHEYVNLVTTFLPLWRDYQESIEVARDVMKERVRIGKLVKAAKERLAKLEIYRDITSKSGIVIKEVLDKLTDKFSNELFKFTTARVQKNGVIKPDMTLKYRVRGRWMEYKDCSDGQMTLCDLYFIHCITTGVGLVYMDETLKFLDEENTHYATELLSTMKSGTIWLSSHLHNIRLDNSGEITSTLDEDGVSHYDINLI